MRTLVIPDMHVKPEQVRFEHVEALTNFILKTKPDVIVWMGDLWDLPSIFADKRAKNPNKREWAIRAEGRRVWSDIESGKRVFKMVQDRVRRSRGYKPRQVFLEGNHENELCKFFDSYPVIDNPARERDKTFLSRTSIKDFVIGQRVEFLDIGKPLKLHGILFQHFFTNKLGNPIQIGTAPSKLLRYSHVWAHSHTWDMKQDTDMLGFKIFWLCAGSFKHPNATPKGNWSGITVLHHNEDGDCDVEQVSVQRLMSEFT